MQNRTVFLGDNFKVIDKEIAENSIDLIVTDPPYGKNKNFGNFNDEWEYDRDDYYLNDPEFDNFLSFVRSIHSDNMYYYLKFMAVRLNEFYRVLKKDGSIYLQCDHTSAEYLKLLMDLIFGMENYRNSIAWCYTGPSYTTKFFPRKHDTILFYSNGNKFNKEDVRIPYKKLPTAAVKADSTRGMFKEGHNIDRLKELNVKGKVVEDYWIDIEAVMRRHKESRGYSTQKPIDLYKRMILASSNENDLILDPFCGSGASLIAAEQLNRKWIGIDSNKEVKDFILRSPLWVLEDEN